MTRCALHTVSLACALALACGDDSFDPGPDASPADMGRVDGGEAQAPDAARASDNSRSASVIADVRSGATERDARPQDAATQVDAAPELGDATVGDAAPDASDADTAGCPIAVATVVEGDAVEPQTTLHLIGSNSHGGIGSIDTFAWSATRTPDGAVAVFSPSASTADPSFEVNLAGTYELSLTVTDSDGVASCEAATVTVVVTASERLHIELVWDTPGDADQTDEGLEAGADVDLHFAHPLASQPDLDGDGAPDPWFDPVFDCFWLNAMPNWGSTDPAIDDDPSLDRDDTDGAGPENTNLNLPEDVTYSIGVHYWDDHGFGPSVASVRIYVDGVLAYESPSTMLSRGDMWRVATLTWNAGTPTVTAPAAADITPNYCPSVAAPCP